MVRCAMTMTKEEQEREDQHIAANSIDSAYELISIMARCNWKELHIGRFDGEVEVQVLRADAQMPHVVATFNEKGYLARCAANDTRANPW
jgi:hypothetical protein